MNPNLTPDEDVRRDIRNDELPPRSEDGGVAGMVGLFFGALFIVALGYLFFADHSDTTAPTRNTSVGVEAPRTPGTPPAVTPTTPPATAPATPPATAPSKNP